MFCRLTSAVVLLVLVAGCGEDASLDSSFPTGRAAVTLLRVYRDPPTIVGHSGREVSERDYDIFRNTQIKLLKSLFVIEAALRPPEVAEIKQVAQAEDPVEWVRERLHARFPGNGEIMEIALFDDTLSDEELTTLTDSVLTAYVRDVVESERIDRLRMKELLEGQLELLRNELTRKRQEHAALAQGLGRQGSPFRQARIEMLLHQHRDVHAERRVLARKAAESAITQPADVSHKARSEVGEEEGSGLAPSPEAVPGADARGHEDVRMNQENLQKQMEALEAEAEDLEEQLAHLAGKAADIAFMEDAIRNYEELVDVMGEKLLVWDVELAAGSRIRTIQGAVVQEYDGEDEL